MSGKYEWPLTKQTTHEYQRLMEWLVDAEKDAQFPISRDLACVILSRLRFDLVPVERAANG